MVEALVMNGAVDEAWKLVHEMLSNEEHSGCVNTVIYSTVMKGFSHARRPDMCFSVLDEMHARQVEANTITYNTLLDACAKCSSMARVPEVFEEMKRGKIEPDKITYSTLIKGYCMVGELDCAFDLFEEMQADGKVGLDEIVYNALIDGCGRQQKVPRALQVLADMKRANISPSNYTLSILVKLLGRARKLNDAIALVDDFRTNYRVRPNVQVYTCLMQACLLNRRVGQALTVYNKMINDLQCLPDQKAFSVLLNGCIQAGALKEAVQVARCAYNLPGQGLEKPDGRQDRPVGVENKIMSTLDSKIRQQKPASDVIEDWEEVMETAGWRGAGRGQHGNPGDDRPHGKGDDRGRKGSGRPKGKGKGKDSGKDSSFRMQ
jgi:pentatricopeptide repeat protein